MSRTGAMTYEVTVGANTHQVTIRVLDKGVGTPGVRYGICIDGGAETEIESTRPVSGVWSLLVGDACWEAGVSEDDGGYVVDLLGIHHEVAVVDPRRKALQMADGGGSDVVKVKMPGRVVRILVEEGSQVSKGEAVIVVEAMKMENELKAPRDGVVQRICVAPDQSVEAKTVLIELER
mgnify:CR=1 FL=1